MKTRIESNEVLYAEDPIVSVSYDDVEWLKQKGKINLSGRIRLCSHPALTNKLHEMIIILRKNAFVQPHKHPQKSESIHIIEGVADVVVFNDDGIINQILPLGDYGSGRKFYCRMNSTVFHTLLTRSDYLIFHETINGPFKKDISQFPPWSPAISDPDGCKRYVEQLNESVARFIMNNKED
jgi:cupin fold WbuC family metalloprotein